MPAPPFEVAFFVGASMDSLKSQYESHKSSAKARGIEFALSFEEWEEIWGGKIHQRGTGADQLGMLRFRDEGGYTKGNVYLGTPKENRQEAAVAYRVKKSQAPVKSSDFAVTAPARGVWLWRADVFKEYVEEEEYS